MEGINYFREFIYSKFHAYFGGSCLGLALLSGNWFVLIVSLLVYGLGVFFIHETPFFKNKIDAKYQKEVDAKQVVEIEKFKANRDKQLSLLTPSRKNKYIELSLICKEIEKTTIEQAGNADEASNSRLRRLDELMFTYLKLLSIEQSLQIFIESEKDDQIAKEVKDAEDQVAGVNDEIKKAQENPNYIKLVESKQRLLISYQDRLDTLKKRIEKYDQAKCNLQLVSAEQSRLSEQIKLLRADTIASRNAESISTRIDASVSNLDATNQWLSQMNEFKDVVGDIPQSSTRIGFDVGVENVENKGNFQYEYKKKKEEEFGLEDTPKPKKTIKRKTYEQ